ncbi:class III signal peptide-containing protein [Thermococcus sp. M39]|uniref:class III signal peptide-containing protein n=1 Tax=unclassified Thermococcus TaxID=2627626 RepID=UPI0014398B16|nr:MULTISPECIES: hypothetical protein [unclassified Thermococcus]NJE07778.1 class III signal peptide-containing protein [Thermococcus sp. M39]NJE12333.1 class III signal peptide-containing protein [Thermococcus sp. LS2]
MRKGQGSLGYLFLIAVAIIIVAIVIKYSEPAVKEVPITGIIYIDPEGSAKTEETDTKIAWQAMYKYPPECRPIAGNPYCDFYVTVNLKYYKSGRYQGKYRIDVYVAGDAEKIKKIKVQLCNGWEYTWSEEEFDYNNPNLNEHNKAVKVNGKTYFDPGDLEFPCQVIIMAWMK